MKADVYAIFDDLKVGDEVIRMMGGDGGIKMPLKVTALDDRLIHCGPWTFDRRYGYEIDEDMGWGIPDAEGKIASGSFLRLPPEADPHWKFLDEHVAKNGYFFIIDALEREFRIDKPVAITIYDEWKAARPNPEAEAQLKSVGQTLGAEIEKALGEMLEESA